MLGDAAAIEHPGVERFMSVSMPPPMTRTSARRDPPEAFDDGARRMKAQGRLARDAVVEEKHDGPVGRDLGDPPAEIDAGRTLATLKVVRDGNPGHEIGIDKGRDAQLETAIAETLAPDDAGRRASDDRHIPPESAPELGENGPRIVLPAAKDQKEAWLDGAQPGGALPHDLGGRRVLSIGDTDHFPDSGSRPLIIARIIRTRNDPPPVRAHDRAVRAGQQCRAPMSQLPGRLSDRNYLYCKYWPSTQPTTFSIPPST